jgi:hypothetical protein
MKYRFFLEQKWRIRESQFGQGSSGRVVVDNEAKYIEFLDCLLGTLQSAEGFDGSVRVDILSTQDPSSRLSIPNTGDTTSSAHKSPLQRICLRCYLQDGFEEVDPIPVEWNWNQVLSWLFIYLFISLCHTFHRNLMLAIQVQKDLQEYLGGLVNLVFEDKNGNDVTVDADVGWQSLVKLVQVKRRTRVVAYLHHSLCFFHRTIG